MENSASEDDTPLRIGPTTYINGGLVRFDRYQSDEIAIEIVSEDGEPLLVATVALVVYGAPHPGAYGLWLKGWSENDGIPNALLAAGIVTLTGRTHRTGFCMAQHAILTDRARAVLAAAESKRRAGAP